MDIERFNITENSWLDEFKLPNELKDISFEELWNLHPEQYGKIKMMGKVIPTPRWQESYGRDYIFSGMLHSASPTPNSFKPFLTWANSLGYGEFNQILINWYENGSHYIGKHSDNESQLCPQSPILTISLGGTRKFRLRKKNIKGIAHDVIVNNGDVIVMCGDFQSELTHEIPKQAKADPRISITFRQFK